jgi:hypothetical protein
MQGRDFLFLHFDRGEDHAQVAVHIDAIVTAVNGRTLRIVLHDEPEMRCVRVTELRL